MSAREVELLIDVALAAGGLLWIVLQIKRWRRRR